MRGSSPRMTIVLWYGPGSAAHRFASATRCAGSGARRSEPVIHAEPHHAEPGAVGHARDRKTAVRQVDIEIFDLRGPVLREPHFGAGADGPAGAAVGFRQPRGFSAQFAEGESAGAVEQHV